MGAILFAGVLLIAALFAAARGGRLLNLAFVRPVGTTSLLLILGTLVTLALTASRMSEAVWFSLAMASLAVLGVWLAWNATAAHESLRSSAGLLATGLACNLAAMVANGGMPVSRHALEVAGLNIDALAGPGRMHVIAAEGDTLRALGDVIALPNLQVVMSPGDLLALAGLALFVVRAMTAPGIPRRTL